ncbi:MAG: glycosyltransferase family 1 protein [Bacteroidota bacterium]|nr:glycosyltransferase family 1 protein [Bacteroidota bacterium]
MKIGINLLYLIPGVVGGTETYAWGLLNGLAKVDQKNEFIVFLNREAAHWQLPSINNFVRVVCPVSGSNRWGRYFFEQVKLPRLLQKYNIDLVHSLGYVSPLLTNRVSVVTIHDLNYRDIGKHIPLFRRVALHFFVKQSALKATRVITVSEFSRNEIINSFNIEPDKVKVTYEASRFSRGFHNEGHQNNDSVMLNITSPYIIAFSSQSAHKNIPRLLKAYNLARMQNKGIPQLVLIGHKPSNGEFISVVNELKLFENIRFTGYLDAISLQTVLCGAQIMVFPSYYEGFGLPVLEAMEFGVPVICSNRAALPEIAGNAALFFNPFDIEDIAEKILQLTTNPKLQDNLREKGYRNSSRFSWHKTALNTLEVYKSAFNEVTK